MVLTSLRLKRQAALTISSSPDALVSALWHAEPRAARRSLASSSSSHHSTALYCTLELITLLHWTATAAGLLPHTGSLDRCLDRPPLAHGRTGCVNRPGTISLAAVLTGLRDSGN